MVPVELIAAERCSPPCSLSSASMSNEAWKIFCFFLATSISSAISLGLAFLLLNSASALVEFTAVKLEQVLKIELLSLQLTILMCSCERLSNLQDWM
jgi:hypothetical protein